MLLQSRNLVVVIILSLMLRGIKSSQLQEMEKPGKKDKLLTYNEGSLYDMNYLGICILQIRSVRPYISYS